MTTTEIFFKRPFGYAAYPMLADVFVGKMSNTYFRLIKI